MATFTVKEFGQIRARNKFYLLIRDGVCEFEKFCTGLEEKYRSQLRTILAYMELYANEVRIPPIKMRDITPKTESVREIEFKTKDLRIYIIQSRNTGAIIILGGNKAKQRRDIQRFRSVKREFLQQYKKTK